MAMEDHTSQCLDSRDLHVRTRRKTSLFKICLPFDERPESTSLHLILLHRTTVLIRVLCLSFRWLSVLNASCRAHLLRDTWLWVYILGAVCVTGSTDAFCPHGCICNDVSVDCDGAGLEVVPILLNPQVVTISLSRNRITSLQESLIFYTDLTSLDLSNNQISSLGLRNFEGQKILRSLSVDNNEIQSLQEDNFYGLGNLKYLSVNNNKLTTIENHVFKGLDALETLNIENNKIKDIDSLGFNHLQSIKTIILVRNKLRKVPVTSISHLISLQELNLCDNQISTVPERAFQHLANLTHLNMSRNNISSISPHAFIGLTSLRSLSLVDNRISTIPAAAFPPLAQLSSLDLSGNLFASLPRDFLGDLPSLVSLRVERCPRLAVVSQDAFVSGWKLQELSLSQNPRLRELPPAALAPLLALKTLDLSSCGLEGLQPTQIPMRELKVLDVSGNPLHCNCSLMWLANVAANHTLAPGIPACAAPPALYGVPLENLGSGTCGPAVGPWTIAGCVGVALAGVVTILAFLACRWRKNRSSSGPPRTGKTLHMCTDAAADLRRPRDFTSPLNSDLPHMQVYSSHGYYPATAPPVQFMYPSPRQPLHSCPSDCPCMRESPALRPLLRTPATTPTQSRVSSKSPHFHNQTPQFLEFIPPPPPPVPNRPMPSVSPPLHPDTIKIMQRHYQYAPPYIHNNLQRSIPLPCQQQQLNNLQLLSPDWLYATATVSDDPQQHWYASIDRSSSSAGAGNESSGYWEEDKELATASLLPAGSSRKSSKQAQEHGSPPVVEENIKEKKKDKVTEVEDGTTVVEDGVPTSYI